MGDLVFQGRPVRTRLNDSQDKITYSYARH
jgi:hypothetical protein